MLNRIVTSLVLLLSVCEARSESVYLDVRPGLWETTVERVASGAPPIPKEALENMPPDMRAKMEERLAKRRSAAGASSTKVYQECRSQKDLERPILGDEDETENKCTSKVISKTASRFEAESVCTSATGQIIKTRFNYSAIDTEHVEGTGTVQLSNGERQMKIDLKMSGRWLAANCGDVKTRKLLSRN